MKWRAYLLVVLLLSAQVNDAWTFAPVSPSAPLADDNDEYLPEQRQLRDEQSHGQEPVIVGRQPWTTALPLVGRGTPFERNLPMPYSYPSLYDFISLQI